MQAKFSLPLPPPLLSKHTVNVLIDKKLESCLAIINTYKHHARIIASNSGFMRAKQIYKWQQYPSMKSSHNNLEANKSSLCSKFLHHFEWTELPKMTKSWLLHYPLPPPLQTFVLVGGNQKQKLERKETVSFMFQFKLSVSPRSICMSVAPICLFGI